MTTLVAFNLRANLAEGRQVLDPCWCELSHETKLPPHNCPGGGKTKRWGSQMMLMLRVSGVLRISGVPRTRPRYGHLELSKRSDGYVPVGAVCP
jgi:hypothetical protein